MKVWFEQGLVFAFLFFIGSGLVRTFTGWPNVENNSFIHFAYGTMAPYQGYETEVRMLKVEELRGETWSSIELDEFWPFSYPEQSVRGYFLQGYDYTIPLYTGSHLEYYARFAKAVYEWRQTVSDPPEKVRIGVEIWPLTLSFPEFLHNETFTTYTWLTQYP